MTPKKNERPQAAFRRELRADNFEIRTLEDGRRALTMSASSEYPVERWGGKEVLSHDPTAVRMDRLESGSVPLLFNHEPRDVIGMVRVGSLSRGRLKVDAEMFNTPRAQEVAAMLEGGLRNVSIGYQIHAVQHDMDSDTFTATDWEPYEVSIVSVPADPTVGVGRDLPLSALNVRVFETRAGEKPGDDKKQDSKDDLDEDGRDDERAGADAEQEIENDPHAADKREDVDEEADDQPGETDEEDEARADEGEQQSPAAESKVKGKTMGAKSATKVKNSVMANAAEGEAMTTENRAAGNGGDKSGLDVEKDRIAAIESFAQVNRIDERTKRRWITSGMPMKQIADEIVAIHKERSEHAKPDTMLGLSERETQAFSLSRAIVACYDGDWKRAGFEAEVNHAIAQKIGRAPDPKKFFVPYEVQLRGIERSAIAERDRLRNDAEGQFLQRAGLYAGSAAAGGNLVATNLVSFIELLRNRAVVFRLGAIQMSGLVGNVAIPRQTGAATAYWLANDQTQINSGTSSDQQFGQLQLSPKNVGGYTEISRQLLMQSTPEVEGIVNADLAAIVALAVDKGALAGSGSAGQPTGITNTTGVNTASGLTTIAYSGVLDFQYQVWNNNVQPVRGGYAATGDVAKLLMTRTKFANTATPLWDGNLWDGNVCGFPGMSSKQVGTSGTMLFGDWAQLIVAEWGVLEIEVNPYANFQAGVIGVRALMTCDIGLRYAGAFTQGTSIT